MKILKIKTSLLFLLSKNKHPLFFYSKRKKYKKHRIIIHDLLGAYHIILLMVNNATIDINVDNIDTESGSNTTRTTNKPTNIHHAYTGCFVVECCNCA